jgi:3-oxoacyl-[acyl-carrier-protein] synthase-3|tara:strand:+ start:671 stop:1747 length:1077 start_codon:yes stop_codon:yes gene_type:complete
MSQIRSVITGSGHYLPSEHVKNSHFEKSSFHNEDGTPFATSSSEIIQKFYDITGIRERRYMPTEMQSSDMATLAAEKAIADAGIDKESIDQIIVAHNFGDTRHGTSTPEMMPSLAAKVKNKLGIKAPSCVGYDIIFGCPGWVQAMIQADVYIKSGYAKTCLVVGTESLSRNVDPSDRDSMIFSDGAGAVVLSAVESEKEIGIIAHSNLTHAGADLNYLNMGPTYGKQGNKDLYIKMNGRKIYTYALLEVPKAIKSCLDKSKIDLKNVSQILIHQANEKMDVAIGNRLYSLYGYDEMPKNKMPLILEKMGNNSVATVPILYDMIDKGHLTNHTFASNQVLILASVGAGMSINALTYRLP